MGKSVPVKLEFLSVDDGNDDDLVIGDNLVKETMRLQQELNDCRIQNSKLSVELALAKDRIMKQSRQLNDLGKQVNEKDTKIDGLMEELEAAKKLTPQFGDIRRSSFSEETALTLNKPVKLSHEESSSDEENSDPSTSQNVSLLPVVSSVAKKYFTVKTFKQEVIKHKNKPNRTRDCYVAMGHRVDATKDGRQYLKPNQLNSETPKHVYMRDRIGAHCKCSKSVRKNIYQHVFYNTMGHIYKCTQCECSFTGQTVYLNHYSQVHPNAGPPGFTCKDCKIPFPTLEYIRSHVRTVHQGLPDSAIITVKDEVRDEDKVDEKDGQEAEEQEQPELEPKEPEPRTRLPFENSDPDRPRHALVVRGSQFACKCELTNESSKDDIFRHIKSQIMTRICKLCKTKFPGFSELASHMLETHNRRVVKYTCKDCRISFKSENEFSSHQERIHFTAITINEKGNIKNNKGIHGRIPNNNLTCRCGQKFLQVKYLFNHLSAYRKSK